LRVSAEEETKGLDSHHHGQEVSSSENIDSNVGTEMTIDVQKHKNGAMVVSTEEI